MLAKTDVFDVTKKVQKGPGPQKSMCFVHGVLLGSLFVLLLFCLVSYGFDGYFFLFILFVF